MNAGPVNAGLRVIYVAPEAAAGGVGAFADLLLPAIRDLVGDVVEIRHGKPGSDTVAQLRARRAQITEAIAGAGGRDVIVHSELSGGSVESLWPTARLGVRSTAVVHDPPNLVWWPFRTKFLADRRVLNHGLHFGARPVSHQVEKYLGARREYFALSEIGAESIRRRFPGATVKRTYHPTTTSVELPEPSLRPRAVGLFGIVYRGKGFEHIARIREVLPDDIEIRIAGRGTESIPSSPGVTVLGTLDEEQLAEFFGSIQALLMPYGRRSPYGIAYPASAVAAQSISHQTPYIATDHGALGELGAEGGAIVVPGEADDLAGLLAAQATQLLDDPARIGTLHDELVRMCKERTPKQVAEVLVETWSR